jgi:ACS family hexuronate transporter-like MFS transporter
MMSADSREIPGLRETRSGPGGYFRWVICAVLFLGMTKNYMDRQVIGVLKTTLQRDLHWTEIDYGNLVFAFQAAYAAGLVVAGRFIDRWGTRIGYALAVVFWSLAAMAHGLAQTVSNFVVARAALGLSESAVFPASLKATAEWFPQRERALATGIFNAGTNVGALITPLVVPLITLRWGWRWAFFLIGGSGFLWLALWWWVYRGPEEHPLCTPDELQLIRSDPVVPAGEVSWIRLLSYKQTWAVALAKFLIDPVWWFYLFWVPDFLQRTHGLTLSQVGLPVLTIYLIADAGSIAGGWLSSSRIKNGWSVNASRKTALLICAVCALPIVFAPRASDTWSAVLLIGVAAAAHQGFSTNLFTLPSDLFPPKAVASVVGFGGMAGAFAGMLAAKLLSLHLQWTGSYKTPFLMAGTAYLIALAVIQAMLPRLEPARLE